MSKICGFKGFEFSFTLSKTYSRTAKVLGDGWLVGDVLLDLRPGKLGISFIMKNTVNTQISKLFVPYIVRISSNYCNSMAHK